MKLSPENKKMQAEIMARLRKGLPLTGLLALLATGCDEIHPPWRTMGRMSGPRTAPGKTTTPPVMGDIAAPEEKETADNEDVKAPAPQKDNSRNEKAQATPPPLVGALMPPPEIVEKEKPQPPEPQKDNSRSEMKDGDKMPPPLMGKPAPPKMDKQEDGK